VTGLYALTVKQPWAHMITRCGKTVENRGWPVPRGRLDELAIHAGARSGWDDGGEFSPLARNAWNEWSATLPPMNVAPLRRESLFITFSAIVAVAVAVTSHHAGDCLAGDDFQDLLCSPWAARGQFHWRWESLRVLAEPVPCRGFQRLWTVPEDTESAVRAQIPESKQ
jgi:hypothetical protein